MDKNKIYLASLVLTLTQAKYILLLSDFGDFNLGVFLAVTSFLVDALFRFVADNADFVTLHFGRDYFGLNLYALYCRCTDFCFVAVDYE